MDINSTRKLFNTTKIFFAALFAFLLVGVGSASGAIRTASVSGNWDTTATWGGNPVPVAADLVVINDGINVTVNTAAVCASFTIPPGGNANTITISGTNSLTVTGLVSIGAPTSNNVNKTVDVAGGTLSCGSISMENTTKDSRDCSLLISTGTVNVSGSITMAGSAQRNLVTFSGAGLLNISGIGTMFGGGFTASTGTVNYSGASQIVGQYTYNNLTLSGSGIKTFPFGTTTTTTVSSILSMEGTATTTVTGTLSYGAAATLQYKSVSAAQTTGNEFITPFTSTGGVIIDNSNGVILGAARSINSKLTLTNGKLTTNATNLLSITNTSNLGISGGSATSYINGPLKWNLPTLATNITYNFPIGKATYLPFSLVNPRTTGTTTVQVEAFSVGSGGSPDNATLTAISPNEYWSFSVPTSPANFTSSSVSIARQSAISPTYDAVGVSTALTGTYTSLDGTAGVKDVSNSTRFTYSSTPRFFVFAKGKPTITVTPNTSLTDFGYQEGLGPSSQLRSFTVSAKFLTTNITVTPTDSFEVSLSSGAYFTPQTLITLNVFNGVVAPVTIYVRMKAGLPLGAVAINKIKCIADVGTTKTADCSGSVVHAAVITPTPASLSGFSYNVSTSGPSQTLSFTVTTTYLSTSITVTAPTDYEVQIGAGAWAGTQTLPSTGGTVNVRLKSGLYAGAYVEDLILSSITASGTVTKIVPLSGSVNQPTINASTFSLGGFIYTAGAGITSGEQTFKVSGQYLTANLVLTAPTSFEISLSSGSGFAASLSLPFGSGTVDSTTIYVRMQAGISAGTTVGPSNLTATSTKAIQQNVALSGKVVSSATSISSSISLLGFVYTLGNGPSVVQSFTVSGTSLAGDITVTAPTNFEISLDASTWVSSFPIHSSGGIVNAIPAYVRMKANLTIASPGPNYSGDITLTSSGATQPVSCSGVVIPVPSITASASGTTCDGSTITLNSSAASGTTGIYWTYPNGTTVTGASIIRNNFTTADNGTYTVIGSSVSGVNLIKNGDFSSGNQDFVTSYNFTAYGTPNSAQNNYTVGPNPYSLNTGFCNQPSGRNGTGGNQMIIDGATLVTGGAGVVVWSQSVSVASGASYQFSYWVQNLYTISPAKLQLYVNGTPVGSVHTVSTSQCAWEQVITTVVNSGSAKVFQLSLVDQTLDATGNDFSLDDIVFQQAFTASSTVAVTVSPSAPVSVSITASTNPIYTGGAVFTAVPVNGGTAPTFQWYKGGALQSETSSTYTATGLVSGTNVYCILHSNDLCPNPSNGLATSNSLPVVSRTNFWVGSMSTVWGNPNNWSGGYVPAPGNDVEFATTTNNLPSLTPAQNDLELDVTRTIGNLVNASNQSLVIPAGKGLTVNYLISTDAGNSRILIKSAQASVNGSLIFHNPVNLPVNATVEMYSQATITTVLDILGSDSLVYNWQFFGIPLDSVVAQDAFTGSYVRQLDETKDLIDNHWTNITSYDNMYAFKGYEICQPSAKVITFQGNLVNSDFNSGVLIKSLSSARFPGQYLFANPYTAAIQIKDLYFGSADYIDNAVYLYNTGTIDSWTSANGTYNLVESFATGQYVSVPRANAEFPGIPHEVSSMGSMLVRVINNNSDATFGIRYSSVKPNEVMQRAPANGSNTDKIGTVIDLKSARHSDKMWLITNASCTRGFDNGWDGQKIPGSALTPQLFAMEADGNYQVNSVPDVHDTEIGFQAGEDVQDTLIFTHYNIEKRYAGLYLQDLVENKTVDITVSGSTYAFMAASTPEPVKRFRIVTRPYEKNASDAESLVKVFSSQSTIFVQNLSNLDGECILFDIAGNYIKKMPFGANGVTTITSSLKPGAYIAVAVTGSEKVSKRLIVR